MTAELHTNGTAAPPGERPNIEPARKLLGELRTLYDDVVHRGEAMYETWAPLIEREAFRASAQNLSDYLVLREHDIRPLQTALMPWGLSSLGRIESKVLPNLEAVLATLELICERESKQFRHPPLPDFFQGEQILSQNLDGLFGPQKGERRIRILVTMPSEAATDYNLMLDLVKAGMDAIRINCASDTLEAWQAMIGKLRTAEKETGRECKVMMDLAGQKIRMGTVLAPLPEARLYPGEKLFLSSAERLDARPEYRFQAKCSMKEVFEQVPAGAEVWIDDGKARARVERVLPEGLELVILDAGPKGMKLKPYKGINFPDTKIALPPLSEKDYRDLDFAAQNADIIGYSFVQETEDIELLQTALKDRIGDRWCEKAIIAKIETRRAVANLPALIVAAAGKQPFGVMIARGDLAVEIGYERLAEIQEEMLWLCEAAHVPVVWATQVLESLVKTGTPSRAEMTDAAMSERADCVMLNKGPYIVEAVRILNDVLLRMQAHQLKKTPQLRALHVWHETMQSVEAEDK